MAKPARKAAKRPAAKPVAKRTARVSARPKPAVRSKPPNNGTSAVDKQRFTLHGFALSGPTYTVALMLALCKHPFSYIHINLREGAHKQPDFLVKNRFGQVPCLRDGQIFLSQSAAILEHLSTALGKFDAKTPLERQRVREWLFWTWDKLAGPVFRLRGRARGLRQFGDETRVMYDGEARAALNVLDHELAKSEWLVGRKPTIADIDVYAVLRYAGEAGLDVTAWPKVADWKKRFEALPGFGTPEQILPLESRLI
jgi:glutathione S-transferase